MTRFTLGMVWCLAGAVAAFSRALDAQRAPVRISLASSEAEQQGRAQLERILAKWDLSQWLFTRDVQVQMNTIPHSHPILTVNTNYLGNDTAQVATFIHEQLHWFFDRDSASTDSAIAELRKVFPNAPSGGPQGARDQYSSYLHLLVCMLEYEGMRRIFNEDVAQRTTRSWRHYTWIYQQVLEKPDVIRKVLRTYRLEAPDARTG